MREFDLTCTRLNQIRELGQNASNLGVLGVEFVFIEHWCEFVERMARGERGHVSAKKLFEAIVFEGVE